LVERGAVRRYAQAIMDVDPIYMGDDPDAAERFGGAVAPPLFPILMLRAPYDLPDVLEARATDPDFDGAVASSTYGLPPLPGKCSLMNGGVEVELFRYLNHGEELFVEASYESISEKETSKGWMVFVVYDCRFFDGGGKLVVRLRRTQIRR
jgi:hypothetical protein